MSQTEPPPCDRDGCDNAAAFWLYPPDDTWRPICERHLVHLHPSLEVHAWLTSGYARPIELDRPTGPPAAVRGGRPAAFRRLVDETLADED